MARILFLNPAFYGIKNFCRSARWFAISRGRVQRHPDYNLIAVAILEKAGHNVKFIDAACLETPFKEIENIVKQFKPEIIITTTTTPSIYNDIKQASKLKKISSALTVLIGSHVSALPEESLKISKNVDVVVRGEFDYTLRELAEVVDGKRKITSVLGITYRRGNRIKANPDRPFIENLDKLPFPAWHHIEVEDYFDAGKLHPFITLLAGRGCPYRCTFCILPQTMFGRKYRMRSVKNVVDEIEYDFKLFPNLKEVMFEDDTLVVDKKRCREICKEIIKRGLNKRLSFSGNSRADVFDLKLFRLMKKANFRMLVVGFEFGDQNILNAVHKDEVVENMKRFAKLARMAGLKIHGCFMIGGPGETAETSMKTIKLAKELGCDTLQFSALVPYPGTEFYNWCKENNFIIAKDWTDWVDAGEQSTVVSYPQLHKEKILEFVDKGLYSNFYFRPRVWAHHILTIKNLSDLKRKIKGFLSLLDYKIHKTI